MRHHYHLLQDALVLIITGNYRYVKNLELVVYLSSQTWGRNIIDRMFILIIPSHISHTPRASKGMSTQQPASEQQLSSPGLCVSVEGLRSQCFWIDRMRTGVETILHPPNLLPSLHFGEYVFLGHTDKKKKTTPIIEIYIHIYTHVSMYYIHT